MININTVLIRKDIVTSQMDEELVMMDLESNNYFGLNKVGKDIWQLLENEISLDSLVNELIKKYDISYEKCKEEIVPFLEKLQELNLIEIN